MAQKQAFLQAIREAPDDDAPRLVYADWLDEQGDVDQAEFIRVQCRLAATTPADPEHVDLAARERELAARLKPRFGELSPARLGKFNFGWEFFREDVEPFRRGFPYFTDCQIELEGWARGARQVAAGLERLVRTTTIRGLRLYAIPPARLAGFLALAAVAELTGLTLPPNPLAGGRPEDESAAYRLLAGCPALRRVRHLDLWGVIPPGGVVALAGADSLDSVRRFSFHSLDGPRAGLARLTAARWFRNLHHLRIYHLRDPGVASAVADGLGELPGLHTLDLPELVPPAVAALAAGRFPALGRLVFGAPLDPPTAATLARARFPRLAEFSARRQKMGNEAFQELLRADWFSRLRVLDLAENAVGSEGIRALAGHPAARSLRVLRLGNNPIGKAGLKALARPGAFPELTSLHLGSCITKKATADDLVAFVSALSAPRLRHLDLSCWPIGDAGARAVAGSPALAGLTRLDLAACRIGDAGAKALFASPHLQGLVELDLSFNHTHTAAEALADPAVLPRLGECGLSGGQLPEGAAAKIRGAGRWVSV